MLMPSVFFFYFFAAYECHAGGYAVFTTAKVNNVTGAGEYDTSRGARPML